MLPLLLMILIGTIYFGYLYVLQTAATHAAQQAAIAAVAVDPVGYDAGGYQSKVRSVVADTVFRSLEWLPTTGTSEAATDEGGGCAGGAGEDAATGLATCSFDGSQLTVTVTINVAGGSSPLLPQITLPPFGQVPPTGLTVVSGVAKIEL